MSLSQHRSWERILAEAKRRYQYQQSRQPEIVFVQRGLVTGVKAGLSLTALSPEPTATTVLSTQECYNSSGTKITGTLLPRLAWDAIQDAGGGASGQGSGFENDSWRCLLKADAISVDLDKIILMFASAVPEGLKVDNCFIAETDGGDDRDIVDGTNTRVLFGGGNNNFAIAANAIQLSDLLTFAIDETKGYTVTYHIENDALNAGQRNSAAEGGVNHSYLRAGGDFTGDLDWSDNAPVADTKVRGVMNMIGVP